jgi:hypothetical protein
MNEENTKKLFNSYPILYQDKNMTPQETLICFGFECGDGWFELINQLSLKLEELNNNNLPNGSCVVASQVKEKYSTLRFYIHFQGFFSEQEKEYVCKEIKEAEKKSSITCEFCGAENGISRNDFGWLKTLCVNCYKKPKMNF